MAMESWEIVILTGIVSMVSAIISSFVTTKLTQKNEIRKRILEERTKLYFEIFPKIDTLINHPENIAYEKYWVEFMHLKAKMKLLASKTTFREYEKLFNLLADSVNAIDIYDGMKRGEDCSNFDQESLSKINPLDFKLSLHEFEKKYLPNRDTTRLYIQELYEAMRMDLGSNLD